MLHQQKEWSLDAPGYAADTMQDHAMLLVPSDLEDSLSSHKPVGVFVLYTFPGMTNEIF